MSIANPTQSQYLRFDHMIANPKVARRLPASLAWQFHALPLAEENGQITVAMANPDDTQAREAVTTALGTGSCVVQGNVETIDRLLSEIWGHEIPRQVTLQVYAFPHRVAAEVRDYAQAIGDLLGAQVSHLRTIGETNALIQGGKYIECDMVVFEEPDHPLIRRLLSPPVAPDESTPNQRSLPFAVLTARQPRWPLKNILLVLWGERADEEAIDWVVHLARASGSSVTALAVVPPVPVMFSQLAGWDQGLPVLLACETSLGKQMRQTARHLDAWEVEGTLRLRQGPPSQQICREIVKGDYDLVALTARSCPWWQRWLEGDLVRPLLQRADRPILIARPATV